MLMLWSLDGFVVKMYGDPVITVVSEMQTLVTEPTCCHSDAISTADQISRNGGRERREPAGAGRLEAGQFGGWELRLGTQVGNSGWELRLGTQVGNSGWELRLGTQVGNSGWELRLGTQVGNSGWELRLGTQVGNSGWELRLGTQVGNSGWELRLGTQVGNSGWELRLGTQVGNSGWELRLGTQVGNSKAIPHWGRADPSSHAWVLDFVQELPLYPTFQPSLLLQRIIG
uniref:Uncharacterized protein n=1 Tax=Physcomitrium patens TaxID=3218 RepID=A9SLH9_PHYPA|nr:hypothetical protein PHYPA_016068 [Physcomitrium patens]